MWLAKDEYEYSNKDHPLGCLCLPSAQFETAQVARIEFSQHSRSCFWHFGTNWTAQYHKLYVMEICITGSSLSAIKYSRTTDSSAPVLTNGQGSSTNELTNQHHPTSVKVAAFVAFSTFSTVSKLRT